MIRLAVRVRREHAELVLAELLELAPSGVEEREAGEGVVEYAVYGSPGELPELPDLQAAAGDSLVQVTTSELPDDWAERWRRFHRPVLIGAGTSGLRVRPPWERACGRGGMREIVIDPGQAFGTGAHATTRMCLELLLELTAEKHGAKPPAADGRGSPPRAGDAPRVAGEVSSGAASEKRPLLDVGTGSGVLAIAAARLGYSPVVALDNERESVEAARENARVNGASVEVRDFDLRRGRLPRIGGDAPPTVLANLLLPLLLDLARSIECPPADLIAGGLLVNQADEMVGVFEERLNMRERTRLVSGEWASVWLVAASD